ncbi:MAG: hypothetical protein WC000_11310, partial [Dokdonella sp.]
AKYFKDNKDQIAGTSYDEIGKLVDTASAANDGEQAAGAVWESQGPKGYNDPVLLDKMEAEVRKQYPNDAARAKAGIAALRERVAAHNSTQAEVKAGAINSVMDVYSKTRSLAAVQKSPEWQALGGADRMKVEDYITGSQNAALSRANAMLNRDVLTEQRNQQRLRQQGFGAYLAYSNPDTLNGMSESQIQSLLPELGSDLTGHLMEKKRGLTPKTLAEAKIDNDDFNSAAARMGLKPFSRDDHDKEAVGEVKSRVERVLDMEQRQKGKPLTREEKNAVVSREIARTVTVEGFWSNTDKPAISLTAQDLARIKVPSADRSQIAQAMAKAYQSNPRPDLEPTETNIRRWYARSKSPAAALIPNGR